MAQKKKNHKYHRSRIEHHKDGSASIHHQHEDGPDHDVKHAVADLDGVHDSMEDHMGEPNPGEAEANAGNHGVPEEHATPAGIPMPAAPAGVPGAGA